MKKKKTSNTYCHEWAIETDPNKEKFNPKSQVKFILKFIGDIYNKMDKKDPILSEITDLHFTRIFMPERDEYGSYLRLRIFIQPYTTKGLFSKESEFTYPVINEIERMLKLKKHSKFYTRIKSQPLKWHPVAKSYGGPEATEAFKKYLTRISRTTYDLLLLKQKTDIDLEQISWAWTHFFFNQLFADGKSIIVFPTSLNIDLEQQKGIKFLRNI